MKKQNNTLPNFLFELGSLRKIPRAHMQSLLTCDLSDNIASHSFRVAMLAWLLAHLEKADPYKATTMAMFHDIPEARSGDQNWVHRKYVKTYDSEIIPDQIHDLPGERELQSFTQEYAKRESIESKIAKDADNMEEILTLHEYAHQGNQEAMLWLGSRPQNNNQYNLLFTNSARILIQGVYKVSPGDWWKNLWTHKRR